MSCDSISLPPGYDPHFLLCCDPPSLWNEDWPVDPKYLWENYFNDKEDDKALWSYDTHYTNNDEDPTRASPGKIDGSDAYGFIMLNGPKEAIDDTFDESYTIVRRSAAVPNVKREILTTNKTQIDGVFDHSEEILHAYCNHPPGSEQCNAVFQGGVEDTIIRLPHHVGEGPFARIVYMKPVGPDASLPKHHLEHRSIDNLDGNPVYEVKIDYAFHEVRQDRGNVNIRVDFTNLLGYWEELTDSPADSPTSRIKRGMMGSQHDGAFTMQHFRNRIKRGEAMEKHFNYKRQRETIKTTVPMHVVSSQPEEDCSEGGAFPSPDLAKRDSGGVAIGKRWWGIFVQWLSKLTTVQKGAKGDLPLDWAGQMNLFKASWGCPGKNYAANLRMDLEAEMSMQATYAYYYSGTFIPPSKPDVFFYFGIEPEAYVGLRLYGNVHLKTVTDRKKIIDTLSYPGLAIKVIAAVGPTLDIYGQIRGYVNIQGEARAGARVSFGKAEAYWPQNDEAVDEYDKILDLGLKEDPKVPDSAQVAPTFEAGVQVAAGIDVIIQPEAHIGVKVGGGKWSAGLALVDAQITGFMTGILQFFAEGRASTNTGRWDYQYGAYFYFNLGYKAKAVVLEWLDWALEARMAYNPNRRFEIYKKTGSIDLTGSSASNAYVIDDPAAVEGHQIDNATMALFRRDDVDMTDPDIPQFSSPSGQCPDGGKAPVKIPELRLHCGAFPEVQITDPKTGNVQNTKDLCSAYKKVGASGRVLTHTTAFKARTKQRRTQQCSKVARTCKADQQSVLSFLGLPSGDDSYAFECDQFPWTSAEEGGNFLPADKRSQTCVPSYQNYFGGQCIGMLNNLQTNVAKLQPPASDDKDGKDDDKQPDVWVYWGAPDSYPAGNVKFWHTETTIDGVTQRFTEYPADQPIPVGYNAKTWKSNSQKKSWMFKRNYTISLIDDGSQGKEWWDATDYNTIGGKKLPDKNSFAHIFCAVNTFGQDDVYKQPKTPKVDTGEYNALCFYGDELPVYYHWPNIRSYTRCKVDFGSPAPANPDPSKRSTKGTWGGWEVKNVTLLNDNFSVNLLNDNFSVNLLNDNFSVDDPRHFTEVLTEREEMAKAQAKKGLGEGHGGDSA